MGWCRLFPGDPLRAPAYARDQSDVDLIVAVSFERARTCERKVTTLCAQHGVLSGELEVDTQRQWARRRVET